MHCANNCLIAIVNALALSFMITGGSTGVGMYTRLTITSGIYLVVLLFGQYQSYHVD